MASENPEYIYQTQRLGKRWPNGNRVLENISLSFYWGAKIGVIGNNAAGKSTLLRIMAGEIGELEGEAAAHPTARIGYLPQEPTLDPDKDVMANVREGLAETLALLEHFDALSERLGEEMSPAEMEKVLDEQASVQDSIDACNGWDVDRSVEIAMEALRCPPGDADVTVLSGGERRRVALARLLVQRPDLLLLDEPTNHLDAESVAWLEHHLQEYAGTVVAITHDRYFLDNVAGWILEIDRGRGLPWKGNYSSWLEQKQQRLFEEEKKETARSRALARELEWARMTPKARHQKTRARLTRYEQLLADSGMEREERVEEMYLPPAQRLGDVVIEAEGLHKGYGDRLLIEDLTFSLPPGGIVGVVGGNGAGKTTLLRMLTGQEQPDSGTLRVGDTVDLAYVDQSRDALDPDKSVFEEISQGADRLLMGGREVNSRAYVSQFNFKGRDQQKRVGDLSGGERNRVHLAKLLQRGGNVLLLDEPTNDLDVHTLRALEDALVSFAGCAVVVTHDRWFLDRIATHVLAFEGNSHVEWFGGNYADYEKDRKQRLGDEAETPRRLVYKRIA